MEKEKIMSTVLSGLLVVVFSGICFAGELENAAGQAQSGFFGQLGGFHLGALHLNTKPDFPVQFKGVKVSADWASLFVNGDKVSEQELTGWFAGRRFTAGGPAAQLLIGDNFYNDPKVGPVSGQVFKVGVMGPKVAGIVPETLYDMPGSQTLNGTLQLIWEKSSKWRALKYKGKSAIVEDGDNIYEIRKSGTWFICKYANGDYGYFFRKVG